MKVFLLVSILLSMLFSCSETHSIQAGNICEIAPSEEIATIIGAPMQREADAKQRPGRAWICTYVMEENKSIRITHRIASESTIEKQAFKKELDATLAQGKIGSMEWTKASGPGTQSILGHQKGSTSNNYIYQTRFGEESFVSIEYRDPGVMDKAVVIEKFRQIMELLKE